MFAFLINEHTFNSNKINKTIQYCEYPLGELSSGIISNTKTTPEPQVQIQNRNICLEVEPQINETILK